MNPTPCIDALRRFPERLAAWAQAASREVLRFRPTPESWSPLEILGHLLEEERHDFRPRLRSLIEDPGREWPPLDPVRAVADGHFEERDLAELLEAFRSERERSLEWLGALGVVDWERSYSHRTLGPLSAGDLLLSWASHDLLHVKQLARREFEFLARAAKSHSSRYAGEWT